MATKQQDHRLQQEILRNMQRSSSQWDPRRPAIVHISPAANGTTPDTDNLVFTFAAREEAPSNGNNPPIPPDATSAGSSASPNGTPIKKLSPSPPIPDSPSDTNDARIHLSDGTQIFLNRPDQIVLIGPTGLQMTINCLPLYKLPNGYSATPSSSSSMLSPTQEADRPLHIASSAPTFPSVLPSAPSKSLSSPLKCSTLPLDTSNEEVDWGLDDGSDTDENKADDEDLSINYVPTQEAVPLSLMRSSGSVSFARVHQVKPTTPFPPISEGENVESMVREQPGEEEVPSKVREQPGEEEVPSKADNIGRVTTTMGRAPPQVPSPYSRRVATRLLSTPLPTPPPCVEPQYMERSGWLTKLSHRKGVFGDRWQKRYFVLHHAQLLYFKKYGDSKPKGRILLLPGSWCKAVSQGTPRMADALLNGTPNNAPPPIVTVLRCIAVHRPSNPARSLSALLVTEGVADAFSSQTVIVNTPEQSSRTFYVTTSSNEERSAWIAAVQHNLDAYSRSPEALRTACIELQSMLCAVSCRLPESTIPSLLTLLYLKMQALVSKQRS